MTYRALVVSKTDDALGIAVQQMDESQLPPGDVTIRVEWSSVNYKDGLACSASGRVLRSYPMVPGIDLAGSVVSSTDSRFSAGDKVLVTGFDLGVAHPGGFAELACEVPVGGPEYADRRAAGGCEVSADERRAIDRDRIGVE